MESEKPPLTEQEKIEALRTAFLSIKTIKQLATFFNIKHSILAYRVYKVPEKSRYKEFEIRKRNGGTRKILAPNEKLKTLQRRISDVLYLIYEPLVYSHGFEKGKSIKTNAQVHSKQRFILNVDIKAFFPSINFGRVRGMFIAKPFQFPPDVATILAQICCHNNELPQGAPSSPIISNIICYKLDRQLSELAIGNKCYYSRYADDLSFSTSHKIFPSRIGKMVEGEFMLSVKIKSIIKKNGFEVNKEKISFHTQYERQIVTGVVVNVFPNVKRKFVRQVRAMLNAWKEYGLEEAEREYYQKYNKKNRNPERPLPSYRDIVQGKVNYIGYIRQKKEEKRPDGLFQRLKTDLAERIKEDDSVPKYSDAGVSTFPLIITEGHTDWKHLTAALAWFKARGKFTSLDVEFWTYDQSIRFGDSTLINFCKKASYKPKTRKYICVFDSDSADVVKKMKGIDSAYKIWPNSVYSFCIPIPTHRTNYANISIEMYYTDAEVNTIDSETGKRLFFTNQVKESTETNLTSNVKKNRREMLAIPIPEDEFNKKIFDYQVDTIRDANDKHIAHSKTVFAARIANSHKDFINFDFSEFEKIFNVIQEIANEPLIPPGQAELPGATQN